jgi:hypothetical protein
MPDNQCPLCAGTGVQTTNCPTCGGDGLRHAAGAAPRPDVTLNGWTDCIINPRAAWQEIQRLREIERKASEQSAYIQQHGLTEIEQAALRADNSRLRAALEEIEFAVPGIDHYPDSCPWCWGDHRTGHKPDCSRQHALHA